MVDKTERIKQWISNNWPRILESSSCRGKALATTLDKASRIFSVDEDTVYELYYVLKPSLK